MALNENELEIIIIRHGGHLYELWQQVRTYALNSTHLESCYRQLTNLDNPLSLSARSETEAKVLSFMPKLNYFSRAKQRKTLPAI